MDRIEYIDERPTAECVQNDGKVSLAQHKGLFLFSIVLQFVCILITKLDIHMAIKSSGEECISKNLITF